MLVRAGSLPPRASLAGSRTKSSNLKPNPDANTLRVRHRGASRGGAAGALPGMEVECCQPVSKRWKGSDLANANGRESQGTEVWKRRGRGGGPGSTSPSRSSSGSGPGGSVSRPGRWHWRCWCGAGCWLAARPCGVRRERVLLPWLVRCFAPVPAAPLPPSLSLNCREPLI